MNKKEELHLAQRWFESIPSNIYRSYVTNDELYIVIDENVTQLKNIITFIEL